jgi:GT2 family glycosyltransferase
MTQTPKVFVIILSYNRVYDTLECIESVSKLRYPKVKIIVIDNGSKDESVKKINEAFPDVILVKNKANYGYTGGNNMGIQLGIEAGADYVWLLNNDTCVEQNTLDELVSVAESSDDVGLVSPLIYYYDMPQVLQFCGSYVDWNNHKIVYTKDTDEVKNWLEDRKIQICLFGTALLIKQKVINDIGYLDEKYFAYWEDTDFSVRVSQRGYRNLVALKAKVFHKTKISDDGEMINSPQYYYYMARNEFFFWMKHLRSAKKLIYLKKYFVRMLKDIGFCKNQIDDDCTDACIYGVWSALHGETGKWNEDPRIPEKLKKMLAWHPNFWANLLEGNISGILLSFQNRLRKSH